MRSYGDNGLPVLSVGAGPVSTGAPDGRVSFLTASWRPSAASASASPGRGPKPARNSGRSASATPNLPEYIAIGELIAPGSGGGCCGSGPGVSPLGGPVGAGVTGCGVLGAAPIGVSGVAAGGFGAVR